MAEEKQYNTPQTGSYEVYHLLREYLADYIFKEHLQFLDGSHISGFNADKFEKWASDLYRFGHQQNLQSFTKSISTDYNRREFMKVMMMPESISTRYEFLAKVTAYLKFTLGASRWNTLIKDVVGALTLHDLDLKTNYNPELSLLSDLNRKQSEVDEEILRHNHWLVPMILYGLMPETNTIIGSRIQEIISSYQQQVKPKGRHVSRTL